MTTKLALALSLSLYLCTALTGCGSAEPAPETKARFVELVNAQGFYRGNIHTHTRESDGDAKPIDVIKWYKTHGYQFLALTDHDKLVVNHSLDDSDFLTLNGVELTAVASGKVPIHVNAICGNNALVGPRENKSVPETLAATLALSRNDGAVTMLNHPNFDWALSAQDLLGADGFELLEIASGHPGVHEKGDASHPSEEELWDKYLTEKHRVFGAAVDDSHDYVKAGEDRKPGRAWLMAWATELSRGAICDALRSGHFYSSRGSKISALVVTPRTLELAVNHWQPSTDHVDFIGAGGALLERVMTMPARYTLKGGEGYVRAHVFQSKDREAWTQAYYIKYDK